MKKKIFGGMAILAIVAMIIMNVNINSQKSELLGISLANVEALAQEGYYYQQGYICWSHLSGGLSPTRWCSGCGPVWFTTGTNQSICHK
jgi:hypothetical protein